MPGLGWFRTINPRPAGWFQRMWSCQSAATWSAARRLLAGSGRTRRRGRLLFLFAHGHISGDSGVLGPTGRTRRRGRLLCLFTHGHISGDSGVLGPAAPTRVVGLDTGIILLLLARLSQCWHGDRGSKSDNYGEN